MNKDSELTRSDYEGFMMYVYFGMRPDYLSGCIRRAYRDFNRTLTGIRKLDSGSVVYKQAHRELKGCLSALHDTSPTQDEFDSWHRATCERLSTVYRENNYPKFFVGHGQKWINMSLKYIFTVGEERISGFSELYPLCHVPFDNILIDQLIGYGFKPFSCRWSRITVYDAYLNRQKWIRERFAAPPLDVEFWLWQGKELKDKNHA